MTDRVSAATHWLGGGAHPPCGGDGSGVGYCRASAIRTADSSSLSSSPLTSTVTP